MDHQKRYSYHQVAKQLGVPNIILTGVEKNAKRAYPNDEDGYVCHVIKTLRTMAERYDGDWSQCTEHNGTDVPVKRGLKFE